MLINIILLAIMLEIVLFAVLLLLLSDYIASVKELTLKVEQSRSTFIKPLRSTREMLRNFNKEVQKKLSLKYSDIEFLLKMFLGITVSILLPRLLPSKGVFGFFGLIFNDLWKNKNRLLMSLAAIVLNPKFVMTK